MRITSSTKDLPRLRADLVVAFAFEGQGVPAGIADRALRTALAGVLRKERFRGRPSDAVLWNASAARRILVVGLGAEDTAGRIDRLRRAAMRAARKGLAGRARSLAVRLPPGASAEEVRAVAEGVCAGSYRYDRYLTDPEARHPGIERVEISSDVARHEAQDAVGTAEAVGRAVAAARDWVNEPPSRMTPVHMAEQARRIAQEAGLAIEVLGPAQLERLRMGATLAVARGSRVEPRVVHLTYRPNGVARGGRRVALVGKGVTFDSGGLNLKTGTSMDHMKGDMAGAAAVLAAMSALAQVGCAIEVHGFLGLVENMTGADAYKPGDILETHSGKTVEVTNTDAEGRLVLADVLSWAHKTARPHAIVDLATLTGACVVALGTQCTGLFTRNAELRDQLLAAAEAAGERTWAMPMIDEYLEPMQGGPADLRNTGERWGGAISAALFLAEFLPRDVSFAHLDIAGPSFVERDSPDGAQGGTGAGVRTLLRWLAGP